MFTVDTRTARGEHKAHTWHFFLVSVITIAIERGIDCALAGADDRVGVGQVAGGGLVKERRPQADHARLGCKSSCPWGAPDRLWAGGFDGSFDEGMQLSSPSKI